MYACNYVILGLRRNRAPLVVTNVSILTISLVYLINAGYAVDRANTEEEKNILSRKYNYTFITIVYIVLPIITLIIFGLCKLSPADEHVIVHIENVEEIIAHSEPVPLPIAQLVEILE